MLINQIRHNRIGRTIAVALSLAPFAVSTAALAAPAHSAAPSKKCSSKPANKSGTVSRTVSKLTATNTTCADGVNVVKAWGKRAPSPCIRGHFVNTEKLDTCKVNKYSCSGRWTYADPNDLERKFISYNTTCKKGNKKVGFTALVTRASR